MAETDRDRPIGLPCPFEHAQQPGHPAVAVFTPVIKATNLRFMAMIIGKPDHFPTNPPTPPTNPGGTPVGGRAQLPWEPPNFVKYQPLRLVA